MTLRVVGGSAAAASGNGGGGGRGGRRGTPPPRAFKPHPLADHLWNAIYPSGVKSLFRIATIMTRSAGIDVSIAKVSEVIAHVRKYQEAYTWTVPPVEKGRAGVYRKYIASPVNVDDPDYEITAAEADGHLEAVQRGMVSTLRTISTNGERAGASVDTFANSPHVTRTDKRALRGAGAALTGASQIIKDVMTRMGI